MLSLEKYGKIRVDKNHLAEIVSVTLFLFAALEIYVCYICGRGQVACGMQLGSACNAEEQAAFAHSIQWHMAPSIGIHKVAKWLAALANGQTVKRCDICVCFFFCVPTKAFLLSPPNERICNGRILCVERELFIFIKRCVLYNAICVWCCIQHWWRARTNTHTHALTMVATVSNWMWMNGMSAADDVIVAALRSWIHCTLTRIHYAYSIILNNAP